MTQLRPHPRHRSETSQARPGSPSCRAILPGLAAVVVLLLGNVPAFAESCGMGNPCPVVDTLSTNPGTFAPNQSGTVTATAHDPNGWLTRYRFTATAGLFSNGQATIEVYTSNTSESVVWTAPAALGPVTFTVKVWDNGSFGGPSSGNIDSVKSIVVEVQTSNAAPLISSLVANPDRIFSGETSTLTGAASDPDGDPLTWSWTTTVGSVVATGATTAVFTAPATAGSASVTLTVTDPLGASSSASRTISFGGLISEKALSDGLVAPTRVAVDPAGHLVVADRRAGGILVVNSTSGAIEARFADSAVTSVAVDPLGRILAGSPNGARLLDRDGSFLRLLDPGDSITSVTDVATDPATGRHLVLYGGASRVVVFDAGGAVLLAFGDLGDGPGQLRGATGLAVDGAGRILVADAGHGKIHVFEADGTFVHSLGNGRGSGNGEFNQLSAIAVDAEGTVYATDAYQSRISVIGADGAFRQTAGRWGNQVGELKVPTGVAILPGFSKLVVASQNSASLQLFDLTGAVAPPINNAPTAPIPVAPLTGDLLIAGQPVRLETANASDLDYQPLSDEFELWDDTGDAPILLDRRLAAETAGTTVVDVTSLLTKSGRYRWRARAWDGFDWSPWCAEQAFEFSGAATNHAPGQPTLLDPAAGFDVPLLTPQLRIADAVDPDGDRLVHAFEVRIPAGAGWQGVATSGWIESDGSGITSWTLPAGSLAPSLEVAWTARASDGRLVGDAPPDAAFRTPAFDVPDSGSWGWIPGVDDARPGSVRYRLPAGNAADVTLWFELYDVTASGEVVLEVGGTELARPVGVAAGWSAAQSVTIPASMLSATLPTEVRFVHAGAAETWGVRNVSDRLPLVPLLVATSGNTVVDLTWQTPPLLAPGSSIRILRALDGEPSFTELATLPAGLGLLRDTGLPNGSTVRYRAAWVDPSDAPGLLSEPIAATPTAAGGTTPVIDLRLARTGVDLGLSWTPPTSSPSLAGVELYRGALGSWPTGLPPDPPHDTVAPTAPGASVPSGADPSAGDEWWIAVTVDAVGGRGL